MNGLDLLNIPLIELNKELFKRRDFDFITITTHGKNFKQEQALIELTTGVSRDFLYGGAAGGAKSWTGAVWLTFMCECYEGTRWFVGRDTLADLRKATYPTFLKVFKAYGVEGVVYNQKDQCLLFGNGSRIDFVDLGYYPAEDPEYDRFGSYEFTGGWIEEGGEVHVKGYEGIKARAGRHLNDKYGLRPVVFITCNPKKNWMYMEFYTPWKRKVLPADKRFIQAFVQDNPANESFYIEQLRSLKDKAKRERLLLGNWEYDDDPAALCEFDAITDLFTNDHVKAQGENRGSADLAMKGRDRFIAGSWKGMVVKVAIDKEKSTGKEIERDLKIMMIANQIPHSRMVVDSDGLGNYLESYLTGIKEFHGGAQAVNKKEFANLKAECGYKLAEMINNREIRIICTEEQKQRIIEELGVLKAKDVDGDEKRKRIISKDEMKESLGRSPDYLDMLLMGMYFLIKKGVRVVSE
jgi:phage terminase large subunit